MTVEVVVGGPRDVRASRDGPADTLGCVVGCPPHPQAGGTRSNPVLTALGEALARRALSTLRFDYGPWDGGDGEVTDARRALAWAADSSPYLALFGYSFGASVALAAAAGGAAGSAGDVEIVGVSALAPAQRLPAIDTLRALEQVEVPVQVLAAGRDDIVDSGPVVQRARALGHTTATLPADHHFVGQRAKVAERVADFLAPLFSEDGG